MSEVIQQTANNSKMAIDSAKPLRRKGELITGILFVIVGIPLIIFANSPGGKFLNLTGEFLIGLLFFLGLVLLVIGVWSYLPQKFQQSRKPGKKTAIAATVIFLLLLLLLAFLQ